jgi:hypothetical protein
VQEASPKKDCWQTHPELKEKSSAQKGNTFNTAEAKESDSGHNNSKGDKGDQGEDDKKDGNKDNRRKEVAAPATFDLTLFRQMLAQPPISQEPISKPLSMTTPPTISRASADLDVQDAQTETCGQWNKHLRWRAGDQNTDVSIIDHDRARVARVEDNHTPFYLPFSCTLPFLVLSDTDDSQGTWIADPGDSGHFVNDRKLFTTSTSMELEIGTADGSGSLSIQGGGTVATLVTTASPLRLI